MLQSLQVTRALAASSVAAFHLSLMMGEQRYGGQAVLRDYTRHGYLGVDFFFVLSGFIILFAHAGDLGKPGRWGGYLRRRFIRLFPIYWLYTGVFVLLLAVGAGTAGTMPDTALDFVSSLTLVRFSAAVPPLPVAWSLFHELAFYLVFSLLIVNIRLGLAAFVLWALACLASFHHVGEAPPTPWLTYTATANLYFLFGMGAFALYRRSGSGLWELVAGACIVSAAVVLADPGTAQPLWRFVLVTGFSLVLAGLAKLERAGRLSFPRSLVFAGDASYSIYIIHVPLSGLLLKMVIQSGFYPMLGGVLIYWLVLAGTLALGCLAYAAVEKPLLAALGRSQHVRHPQGRAALSR